LKFKITISCSYIVHLTVTIFVGIQGKKNEENKTNYPGTLYDFNKFKEEFKNKWNKLGMGTI